jgi:DNA-binding HxlR family transcriptional regulator
MSKSGKPAQNREAEQAGRFSYEGLDRIMHEKARLGILTSLLANPRGLIFNELKHLCALTDGNLSRHLEVLNQSGLVEIIKEFHQRRPQTTCKLTAEGRTRFLSYITELTRVVEDVQQRDPAVAPSEPNPDAATARTKRLPGWSPA